MITAFRFVFHSDLFRCYSRCRQKTFFGRPRPLVYITSKYVLCQNRRKSQNRRKRHHLNVHRTHDTDLLTICSPLRFNGSPTQRIYHSYRRDSLSLSQQKQKTTRPRLQYCYYSTSRSVTLYYYETRRKKRECSILSTAY